MPDLLLERNVSFLRGMNDSAPATAFQEDEAALLLNYRVTANGEAEVRNGSQRTHTTALNSGAQSYGGVVFSPTSGSVQWVVFVGDTAYYSTDEGGSWTQIATGLREDYWDFATMKASSTAYLLCANGGTSSYKWDGSTWSAIANIRTGTKRIEVHNERLAASDGAVLDLSKIGDFEVWSAPSAIVGLEIQTHDGDQAITALYSWGHLLLVFKRGSTAYVEGYGNADLITAAGSKGISRDVGCIAFRSLAAVGGRGLMWMSRRGFEYMAPGLDPVLVSRAVESFLADINFADIEQDAGIPCGYFYANKLAYECYLPAVATQNDQGFGYRLPTLERPGAAYIFDSATEDGQTVSANGYLTVDDGGSLLRVREGYLEVVSVGTPGVKADVSSGYLLLATNETLPAAVFIADRGTESQRPISVGYDGFVRKLDSGSLDDVLADGTGGVAIGDHLKSRPKVFGDPFRKKRARVARVLVTAPSGATADIAVEGDGTLGTSHSVTFAASDDPVEKKIRTSVRAKELVVDIQNLGAGNRVSGVEIAAERLVSRP